MNFSRIFRVSIKCHKPAGNSGKTENEKSLTGGPTCHPSLHCGARRSTGAMAAVRPWPPLLPPRSLAPLVDKDPLRDLLLLLPLTFPRETLTLAAAAMAVT